MTRREVLRRDWPGILCIMVAIAMLYWLPPPRPAPVQWHVPVPSFIPPAPAAQPEFEPHHRPVWYP
jgi:hypothetical protein